MAAPHHEQRFKLLLSRSTMRLVALNSLVTMDLSACALIYGMASGIRCRTMLCWLARGILLTIRDSTMHALQIMGAFS
jgi:hypothetical protein